MATQSLYQRICELFRQQRRDEAVALFLAELEATRTVTAAGRTITEPDHRRRVEALFVWLKLDPPEKRPAA